MMDKVRGYIFSRPFMGERVPQHVQNLVIRDYCDRHHLSYLLSATEYAMPHCHLILEQVLAELEEVVGIVAYSLFQLPEDRDYRCKVYARFLEYNKCIHFAVEGLKISSSQECDLIETIWQVKQTLPQCQVNLEEWSI